MRQQGGVLRPKPDRTRLLRLLRQDQTYVEEGGWVSEYMTGPIEPSRTSYPPIPPTTPCTALEWDMLTSDQATNPFLHNWNVVFMKYCDGGFWSAENMATEQVSGWVVGFVERVMWEGIGCCTTRVGGLSGVRIRRDGRYSIVFIHPPTHPPTHPQTGAERDAALPGEVHPGGGHSGLEREQGDEPGGRAHLWRMFGR